MLMRNTRLKSGRRGRARSPARRGGVARGAHRWANMRMRHCRQRPKRVSTHHASAGDWAGDPYNRR